MSEKILYLSEKDTCDVIGKNYTKVLDVIEEALTLMTSGNVSQPDKISLIMNADYQNRINCMPAFIGDKQISGVKWVSVFPSNINKDNVEGFTLLSETETGKLIGVINATEYTRLRTAGVGAVAARYLARKDSETIGFIGAGAEAKAHLLMIRTVYPKLKTCFVSSRTKESTSKFVQEMKRQHPDMTFVDCENDYKKAAENADILVTAISAQEPILKKDWIKTGALYIHVAGIEDEEDVALSASKIVCDSWECVKHRAQTISVMYKEGRLTDNAIYADLESLIRGEKPGRETEEEFIYFNSVGLATVDVLLAKYLYNSAVEKNIGVYLDR